MEKRTLSNLGQLQGLLTTLEHQEKLKHDVVASSKNHLWFYEGKLRIMRVSEKDFIEFTPTDLFHKQVAEKLNVPMPYYRKMLQDATSLLDENINHWLKADDKNFLVRTFKGASEEYKNQARSFLSDRYSMVDNYQVLMEALESIKETGIQVDIINAELSDTRMYLKVVCPGVEVKATEMLKGYSATRTVGSGVISGFVLQNSEVGAGAFKISPRGLVLACSNGLISTKDELKNIHLGSQMDELGFNKNSKVMQANLKLIKEQIKHAVKIFLSKDYLNKLINVYTELGNKPIDAPIEKVLTVVAKEYSISEERKSNILKYFIEGGDTRRMGLASAMTREVQDLVDADMKQDTEVASLDMLNKFNAIESAAMKLKPSKN